MVIMSFCVSHYKQWVILLVTAIVSLPLYAAIIVQYDAGEGSGEAFQTNAPSILAPEQVEATLLTTSPDQFLEYADATFFGGGAAPTADNAFTTTNWNSPGDDRYFEFSVTVSNGFALDLQSLELHERNFSTSPTNWFVTYNVDNYTGDLFRSNIVGTTGGFASNRVVLTGSENDALTGTITFRINAQGDSGLNPAARVMIDNIQLNGEVVAIPEPSSLILLGLSLAGLAAYRRSRR